MADTEARRADSLRRLEDAIEEYGRAERTAAMTGGVGGVTEAQEARERAMELAREIIYEGEATNV